MSLSTINRSLAGAALLSFLGAVCQAGTLSVNCGEKSGLNSIGAALKSLEHRESEEPTVIDVSGSCHENIVIKGLDFLTIAGHGGASITDASAGAADVVDIRGSRVTISGMTIDGLNGVNNDAVDCEQASQCTLIGNTILGGADGVGVFALSSALIVGGVIQNGTSDGILAVGDVVASGVAVQGSPVGVVARRGGRATLGVADPASVPIHSITLTIVSNNGTGILASQGAAIFCGACVVQDNTGDGFHLDVSAAATFAAETLSNGSHVRPAVTGNGGHGVSVGDLSSATFNNASTVTGNGQPDIACNSPTSITRGALAAAGGAANTNCTN